MSMRQSTYEVRVWSTATYVGKRQRTYRVRWRAGKKTHGKTFATRKAADSFRAELVTAHRKGEGFNITSGLPLSMEPREIELSWIDHATEFIDSKWAYASPRHRKGLAEALTTATCALLISSGTPGEVPAVRNVLRNWVFNTAARGRAGTQTHPAGDIAATVAWIRGRSVSLSDLMDPVRIRQAVEACALKLDGTPAASATTARKRSALFSALEYAVELQRLPSNPMERVKARRTSQLELVDRRVVINPSQARDLLTAVRQLYPSLEAFFACLYYAGLRPAEARHLRRDDVHLARNGWGELTLKGSTQSAGSAWTDSGAVNEDRALKHRTRRHVRQVPAHPDLVEILRTHLDQFECSPDGRLFVSRHGNAGHPLPPPFSRPLAMGTAYRIWKLARDAALTTDEAASPLGRRPYDLRHACVSTWLNAGVAPTQVAEWAGHSVNVLLRVYAKCVYGQEESAKRRIEEALRTDR